jgi:ubiquinone/menaquinone biosynthesis C-methylase UbiE
MASEELYKKFARYYDLIYRKVDYIGEAEFVKKTLEKHQRINGNKMLDLACGTGNHALLLHDIFQITGVDINPEMLKIAREKVPNVDFIQGDMKKLDLDSEFDLITCLFSAISYNTSGDELESTLKKFQAHLKPGGLLIFDMGLNLENWIEGLVSVDTAVEGDLKLARICQSHLEDGIFNANFVFLVKENDEVDFDIDQHKLGIFQVDKVKQIMEKIGLRTFIYADFTHKKWVKGTGERPIFVGIKSLKQHSD